MRVSLRRLVGVSVAAALSPAAHWRLIGLSVGLALLITLGAGVAVSPVNCDLPSSGKK